MKWQLSAHAIVLLAQKKYIPLLIRGTEAILICFDFFNNVVLNTSIDKTGSPIWCNGEQISNISPVKMVVAGKVSRCYFEQKVYGGMHA